MRPFVLGSRTTAPAAAPTATNAAATTAPATPPTATATPAAPAATATAASAPPPARPSLESWFAPFRAQILGIDETFESPYGRQKLLYADWTATGRAYRPIETTLQEEILPFIANTHTETSFTGRKTTAAYEEAKQIIKTHVHAGPDDALVFCGSGMTSAVNKLQRMLGLRLPQWAANRINLDDTERPVIFVTHMEHHSNHVSWLETIATVEIIPPDEAGNVDLHRLQQLLDKYRRRRIRIAAITACSNVTGIETPYHTIASIMHRNDGFCFVDFAAAAPYTVIDMHPRAPGEHLDTIYFSGHKFLGGPGTPGILLFNKRLYRHEAPDHPGGGTLLYTNPWRTREYLQDIEQREDGGTPPILQAIKASLAIRLKERMGITEIRARESELTGALLRGLTGIPGIQVLAPGNTQRLGIVSFLVKNGHYDAAVRALDDRFGIQCRGGCSCAGTYGHFLLGIDPAHSRSILDRLKAGDHAAKPGWVRLSIHPTTTEAEIGYLIDSVRSIAAAP
jgi:selenocysteine lyase/cysteine desulfurase